MKFLILFLGSTGLVAGGTAITSQQSTRNNITPYQQAYQAGEDCPNVEPPIFDNVAYELFLENPDCIGIDPNTRLLRFPEVDIDGDGIDDAKPWCTFRITGACASLDVQLENFRGKRVRLVPNTTPPVLITEVYLDLNPKTISYVDLNLDFSFDFTIIHIGNLDVTGDGKPDAILYLALQYCNKPIEKRYFYLENISDWPAACATDINNDGNTNVSDLLEVISRWGPCE